MITALLVVTTLVVVPGLGAVFALAPPGSMAIETRIGLVVGLGYALVASVAMSLALAHVLSGVTFLGGVVLASIAVWGLAIRRASPRAHAAALLEEAREAPFALAATLVVLAGIAVTWALYPVGRNLSIVAPWRNWADGLEVAAAGRVPTRSDQWGMELPTAVDKVVLDAFEAGISLLIGADPLPGIHAILTVSALGLAAVLIGLGRELGLRAFAPLVPALALLFPGVLPLGEEFARDLGLYKGENTGRAVALSALLVGMHLLRERRDWKLAVVVGVILALAALTHGVSAVVATLMLGLYAVALLLQGRTRLRHAVASGAAVVVVAAVGYFGMIGLSGGDLGFQRVTSGRTFAGFPPDIDPTLSFNRAKIVHRREQDGHFFVAPGTMLGEYVVATTGTDDVEGVLLLSGFALVTVLLLVATRRFLSLVVVAWGLAATVVVAAFFFSYRYRTQIPADFGVRRLFDYAILVPALVLPATIEAVAHRFLRGRAVVAGVLALAGAGLAVAAAVDRIPPHRDAGGAAAGLATIRHVADVVPCGARMLPNGRTAGTWEALTGRRSVLEGLAPYLRPEIMGRVLPVVIGAREFFRDPGANRAFLARNRVEYVVIVRRDVWLGGRPDVFLGTRDLSSFESLSGLREVSRTSLVTVFAVGSQRGADEGGHPARCPL